MEQVRAQRAVFRLGFVPGATPAKWARVFRARHRDVTLELVPLGAAEAERAVTAGQVDAAILRPPVDRSALHAVPLYVEDPVVVASREHLLAALDETEPVDLADLTEEVLLQPADDVLRWGEGENAVARPGRLPEHVPPSTADAVELVAAGVGVLVVPLSLARLHHRKDVTARPVTGGPAAPVVLSWAIDREDELTEDLVGIVRGRGVNSSRGTSSKAPEPSPRRATPASPRRGPRGSGREGRRRR